MRSVKLNYLKNIIPKKVKNYILIRYEDLKDNYENTLDIIKKKFNLTRKNSVEIIKINYNSQLSNHSNNKNLVKWKKNNHYILNKQEVYNHPDFDKDIERQLGYL